MYTQHNYYIGYIYQSNRVYFDQLHEIMLINFKYVFKYFTLCLHFNTRLYCYRQIIISHILLLSLGRRINRPHLLSIGLPR